ncbi:hypothetical protein [Candidatus Rhodobacter oscarellae]|uniref:hypothetical protein n=1 Tax=Candidatus Rhodobacter oscarellae TaxID=1675527 RepID=UPI00067153BE|nr:hypothetical protein [Candidatus Rhodobacter lobularis]
MKMNMKVNPKVNHEVNPKVNHEVNPKVNHEVNPKVPSMDHVAVIPLDDLYEQQLQLEQGMTALGADRYRSRADRAVERGAEETTAYGNTLLARCTEQVAEGVHEFLRDAEAGRPGRRHAAVKYMKQLDARE